MPIVRFRPKALSRAPYVQSIVAMLVVATGCGLPAFSQTLSETDRTARDAAVVAARNGVYAEPLATLDALRARYPENASLLHDQATVLAWSEDDARAVALAEQIVPADAPRYTQLAIAKSARNLRQFELAASWYDAALANDPDDADALSGRILTAADAGDRTTVLRLSGTLAGAAESNATIAAARAYGLAAIGQSLPALAAYDQVLAADPTHRDALRGKALLLRSMLLPTQALAIAAEHPGLLTAEEVERLRADEAAIRLRLASRTPYPDHRLYDGRNRALALIDDELARAPGQAGRDALLLDRVVALSDANEFHAAVAQFESLPASASRDQPYVLNAAARAYLGAERPEDALALLTRSRELDPANIETQFALVYTWIDLDRYDRAYALIEELAATQAVTNQQPGSPVVKGNEDWLRTELLAGIAEAYGDQLETAQSRLETLLADAPNNADARNELANVYRWRGWLDRSLDQYRQVTVNHDDLLAARLGLAHARIDARDFEAVEQTVTEVTANFDREPPVRRLAERWEIHNRSELNVSASSGDSTGPVAGSDNYAVDAVWYSAPIAYRYRAVVATHDGYAEFPEGESRRRRIGAGIEYRAPRLTVSALISASRDGGDSGLAAALDYRLSDFWSVGAGLESNSDRVQLRAHRVGIEADRSYAQARFAPNELASVSFGIDRANYSDSNSLQSTYADGRYRVVNRPRSKLEATAALAFGQANTAAVPYYSPTRDRSAMLGLTHAFRIFRRYDRELVQTIGVASGRSGQSGFASGSIWAVRYRIDWDLNQRFRFSAGAERLGQFFDGAREHSTIGTLAFTGRF